MTAGGLESRPVLPVEVERLRRVLDEHRPSERFPRQCVCGGRAWRCDARWAAQSTLTAAGELPGAPS